MFYAQHSTTKNLTCLLPANGERRAYAVCDIEHVITLLYQVNETGKGRGRADSCTRKVQRVVTCGAGCRHRRACWRTTTIQDIPCRLVRQQMPSQASIMVARAPPVPSLLRTGTAGVGNRSYTHDAEGEWCRQFEAGLCNSSTNCRLA